MYYAYRPMSPSIIVQHFHSLAMNPIKGPKLRCIIPTSMDVHVAQETLPALFHLKNYPKKSFSISQLKDSALSQRQIHFSQTNEEEEENYLFDYMNEHWCDATSGKLNDMFSDSIRISEFLSPQKETQIMARISLKQLWEECCMEADNLGHEEGEIKIEDHLKLFLGYCNRTNASIRNSNLSPSMPATENRKEYQ